MVIRIRQMGRDGLGIVVIAAISFYPRPGTAASMCVMNFAPPNPAAPLRGCGF